MEAALQRQLFEARCPSARGTLEGIREFSKEVRSAEAPTKLVLSAEHRISRPREVVDAQDY